MRAVALVAFAAVLGAAVEGRADDGRAGAERLQAEVRTVAARVHARAAELAALPSLAAALATDAATVRDLSADELMLAPRPDEIVELGQRWNAGRTVSLLRRPADGPALLERTGAGLRVVGGQLYAVETVLVRPAERADELSGVVAVAQQVKLGEVRAAFEAAGRRARLEVGDGTIELGAAPLGDAAATASRWPLEGDARLLIAAPARASWPVGAAVALALALAAVLLWAVRRLAGGARATANATGATGTAAAASGATGTSGAAETSGPPTGGSAPTPTNMFGRYEMVRRLGRGGMAEVYLARATGEAGFAKIVALKVLLPEYVSDPVAVDHFLDEARLAAQLIHPHIVQIADLGRAGDGYFIAMEYIDGADLSRLIDGCRTAGLRIPTEIGLAIMRQVCAGLHAAHVAVSNEGVPLGLIHRDVKAANVLVSQSGNVKVGDFGIAKAQQGVRRTVLGEVKGTAEYMAPEQRAGLDIDARADQYGVGAMAYELFSGDIINLDLARLAHLGQKGWPHLTPLAELRPDLPPELGECIFKVLSYEPSARYASCAELEEAFEGIAQRHGLLAGERVVAAWLRETLPRLGITPGSDVTAAALTPSPRRTAAYGDRKS